MAHYNARTAGLTMSKLANGVFSLTTADGSVHRAEWIKAGMWHLYDAQGARTTHTRLDDAKMFLVSSLDIVPDFLADVRRHAVANYEKGGWDLVVECWSDEEIRAVIAGASTAKQAIQRMRREISPVAEQRAAVMAEAF